MEPAWSQLRMCLLRAEAPALLHGSWLWPTGCCRLIARHLPAAYQSDIALPHLHGYIFGCPFQHFLCSKSYLLFREVPWPTKPTQFRSLDTSGYFDSLESRLSDTLKVPLPYSFCYLQAYWCASGSHENAQGLRSSCMIDFTGSFSFVFLHSFLVSPVLRFRLWFVHGLIGACQRNCGLRRSCFYLGVISHLTIVHFSSAASRMFTGLPISVYGFLFSGVGFCTRHTKPLHATKPSVATSITPPPEGRLLRSRLLSSILAFRCSRVVINGTRSAMGFALFLSEWWKKYLLLYTVLFGHCFGKREERFA